MIGKNLNKNLKANSKGNFENILEVNQNKSVISPQIISGDKTIDDKNLLNKQSVKLGLKEEEIDNLGEVKDMDLYKEDLYNFETLPYKRLQYEQRMLTQMPGHLKGCKKTFSRMSWTNKQNSRIEKARKTYGKHKELLKAYKEARKANEEKISEIINDITSRVEQDKMARKARDEGKEFEKSDIIDSVNAPTIIETLKAQNSAFVTDVMNNLFAEAISSETEKELGRIIKNFTVDGESYDPEKRKKDKKKKAQNVDISVDTMLLNNEKMYSDIELKDMSALFRDVLKMSSEPINDVVNVNGKLVEKNNRESRYTKIIDSARKILEFAEKGNIAVPEELYCIVEIQDKFLLKENSQKFNAKDNMEEAYVLLMAATSKVFYEALNRYAGYYATRRFDKLNFTDDKDRYARNFDIINMDLMDKVVKIKDNSSAYAKYIMKNRLEINRVTEEETKKKAEEEARKKAEEEQRKREQEEAKKKAETERRNKLREEWRNLIRNDIRGVVEVEDKDLKQKEWVLKDYEEDIIKIMEKTDEFKDLTGEPLKRKLIEFNDNLLNNLKLLRDELPKTSVGQKFNYVPRLVNDFVHKLTSTKLSDLLTSVYNFRDELRGNMALDEFLDMPKYVVAKNRQNAIMKAINEELGINFFTDARILSRLWANEDVQDVLLREPHDKDDYVKKARAKVLKYQEDEKDGQKDDNILKRAVDRILCKSKDYGTTDKEFKNAIAKIKANVHDNIAVIDRKISLMGVCDTAKEELRRTVVKSLGGEYLLGYSVVSQDIVEYVVTNMMSYDGTAAETQRIWDKKFAETGLPKKLSSKVERIVSKKVNGKVKNGYYLKPQGFKTGEAKQKKWKDTDAKTDKFIAGVAKLYNAELKNYINNLVISEDVIKTFSNEQLIYSDKTVRLTRDQWNKLDELFDDTWISTFEKFIEEGKYKKESVDKAMPTVNSKMVQAIKDYLERNQKNLWAALKNNEDTKEINDTFISRTEYVNGLKANPVIQEINKPIVADDIEKHVFGDPALKNIFLDKADKDIFALALNETLSDEKSSLHAKYPYLDNVRSIEQIADLDLIDYTQFFADIKANLMVTATKKEDKKGKDKDKTPHLLLEEWRLSGIGGDTFGVKKRLLKEFITGDMTSELFAETAAKLREEALKQESFDKMRIDAMLATESDPNDSYLKFNYLNIKGKDVNQLQRIKKINIANQLWQSIQQQDQTLRGKDEYFDREVRFSELIQKFLDTLEGQEPSEIKSRIAAFGNFLDTIEIGGMGQNRDASARFSIDEATAKKSKTFFGNYNLTAKDLEAIRAIKLFFGGIVGYADKKHKPLTMKECMGEILLFGCGKEYFGAGGAGEDIFLKSDDNIYYSNIAKTSKDFLDKRRNIQSTLKSFGGLNGAEANKILARLKPVIAGLKDSYDQKVMNQNIKKFGIANVNELQLKLMEMYGEGDECKNRLKASKDIGALYIKRREYIDNYGDTQGSEKRNKFRIVRDAMLKDPATWQKIMSCSDEELAKFMKEQDEIYGLGLDVLASEAYRASKPINEQYVMSQWKDFKNRGKWTKEDWNTSVGNFHHAFLYTEVGSHSIFDNLTTLQEMLISANIDKNMESGTALMRMSYVLTADPASFGLLYDANAMFEACKKLDDNYKANMNFLYDTMSIVTRKTDKGEEYSINPETDALYKEIAQIYINGDMIRQKKEAIAGIKILRDLDAKKEPTAEDKMYADYSLLMQILQPLAFTLDPTQFSITFLKHLKDFKAAQQLERNSKIYSDRNVLETKDQVRLDIEIRKNQGKNLERKFLKGMDEYRDTRATLGSIGLVAYNADPKITKKTIDKARDFIEIHLSDNYGQADPEFMKGLLTERAVCYGKMEEKMLSDCLVADKKRLVTLDGAIRKKYKNISEDEIRKAVVFAFAQNANRKKAHLDGTHPKDVEEIFEELKIRADAINIDRPFSQIGRRDYDEFMEEMDVARYTMSKEQFTELCAKKKKYFELVDICMENVVKYSDKIGVQLGLFEYLKKDIFENLEAEGSKEEFTAKISDELSKLVGDKAEGRNNISAEDVKNYALMYLPESTALMQQIASDSVTAKEKMESSFNYTRADLCREIALSGRKDLIEQYNQLNVEEQKVFALALTFPDIGYTDAERLSSNEVLRDKEKDYQKELQAQESLAAFIYSKDFAPKIDYNVVMRRLMKTDKKTGFKRVSKTMFDKAMQYTQFCMAKRVEMTPKDYTKLSNGQFTGNLGRQFAGKNEEAGEVQAAIDGKKYMGAKRFKNFVIEQGQKEKEKDSAAAKLADKLEKYTATQIYMLLHVLQDRTAVDYTTNDGKWAAFSLLGVGYVNQERREQIKNSFTRPDGMDAQFITRLNRSMSNKMYENAAQTLFSYQLRDDVDLTDKAVTSGDFAKGVLKRKTAVDWQLLKRAMELVDEIESENIKIQLCRQAPKHNTDETTGNKLAAELTTEIENDFKQEGLNHFDYFQDMLAREAKKNKEVAMPLLMAYQGLSENEKMLLVHALKNRDILDVSTDNTFTTAIGMNENKYVNEAGRERLADYYIDHHAVPGAKNKLATNQYDVLDALRSLCSTQVKDNKDPRNAGTFADLMEGKKIFQWTYVGSRNTAIDWKLFANAMKFVKRTENERKLLVGNAEAYRAAGDIDKYGRFMYNYQFMRKNLYRSGYRLTRFLGRRARAELEASIPGFGFGKKIMMMCLSPAWRNKMLKTGIVKPGEEVDTATEYLGYSAIGGTVVNASSAVLAVVSEAAKTGSAILGEGVLQVSSALSGLYNVGNNVHNIKHLGKPMENEEQLKAEGEEKMREGEKFQNEEQKLVTKDNKLNTDWILENVAIAAAKDANRQQLVQTVTDCVGVLSASSFGVQTIVAFFARGVQIAINEALHTARFIMSVCSDKKMMNSYFSSEGPLGKEIDALRKGNIEKLRTNQNERLTSGSRDILPGCQVGKEEVEFMDNMDNSELFRKAYGFKDFSEQASYVGWNIVQTLLMSASPYAVDPAQFMRASLVLTALGCRDCIGKQDNDTAQKVFNKLMGQDIR